jgi:hypothetical protein
MARGGILRAGPTGAAASFLVSLAACSLASGCGSGRQAPTRLVDGSKPPAVAAALAGVEHPLGTRLSLRRLSTLPQALRRSCAALPRSRAGADPLVAIRTSRLGSSLSVVAAAGRIAYACDGLGAAQSRRWCGATTGKIVHGRLLDPRLDLCSSGRGIVAFAWLQPLPGARWIVVRDGDFSDVYERGGAIPMRVAIGHDVDLSRASARFRVSQYGYAGRLLASSAVEVAVAG